MLTFWIMCSLEEDQRVTMWRQLEAPVVPQLGSWIEFEEDIEGADFLQHAPGYYFRGGECKIVLEIYVENSTLMKLQKHPNWTDHEPLSGFTATRG